MRQEEAKAEEATAFTVFRRLTSRQRSRTSNLLLGQHNAEALQLYSSEAWSSRHRWAVSLQALNGSLRSMCLEFQDVV